MSPSPESVIALANDLKTAKERVVTLQGQWDAMFSMISDPKPKRLRGPRQNATPALIHNALSYASEPLDAAQIAAFVDKDLSLVRKALQKMFGEGKIERAERGKYRVLAERAG